MGICLSLLGVSKKFGDAQALDGVSFELRPGRIHALVGENGAGKSTALKILAGLESPSSGSLAVDGETLTFSGRPAAIRRGIGLVPQQLSLVPELDLVENLILTEPHHIARRSQAGRRLREAAESAGLQLRWGVRVRELGLAQRQLGELAIALAQGAQVLLLDEPTSALGPYETSALFERMRTLAENGAAVLLITHRIAEVREVADDVTVLSHGRVTLQAEVRDVSNERLVAAMVGAVPAAEPRRRAIGDRTSLTVENVTLDTPGLQMLSNVDIRVAAGEIVGVLGVAGNGQGALADVAAGLQAPSRGRVLVHDAPISGRPDLAQLAGLAYVPEVRADFLLVDRPVSHSSVLRRLGDDAFARAGVLRWNAIRGFARELMERHDVRPRDVEIATGSLSGGNQQKLLVGRELDGAPAVAVLHGPTQGLDLAAAAAIRAEIRHAADSGTGVLLLSADVDEVHELADRVLVLSKGEIVDELPAAEFDLQRIGRAMAGLHRGGAA